MIIVQRLIISFFNKSFERIDENLFCNSVEITFNRANIFSEDVQDLKIFIPDFV